MTFGPLPGQLHHCGTMIIQPCGPLPVVVVHRKSLLFTYKTPPEGAFVCRYEKNRKNGKMKRRPDGAFHHPIVMNLHTRGKMERHKHKGQSRTACGLAVRRTVGPPAKNTSATALTKTCSRMSPDHPKGHGQQRYSTTDTRGLHLPAGRQVVAQRRSAR